MSKLFLFLIFGFFTYTANSQKIELAVEGAANLTRIYSPDKSTFGDLFLEKKVGPGFLLGPSFRFNYSEKCFLKINLFFENRSFKTGPFALTDNNGQHIRDYSLWTGNNYLNWSVNHFVKLSSIFSIGIGINNHFILYSKTHTHGDLIMDQSGATIPKTFNNHYYKPYWLSIPITFHFDIKRVNLWFTFDKSIMSRINKNALFKEFEDCFQVGVGYKLYKK